MWPFNLLSRARRRTPASAPVRDGRPEWARDDGFMAWLRATKPGEFNLVDGWDWRREYHEDSITGSVVKRCNWRWEGWRGCYTGMSPSDRRRFEPGKWWDDSKFLGWHDGHYPLEPYGTREMIAWDVAQAIAEFLRVNPDSTVAVAESLHYERIRALKRRWQGWCGRTQVDSGRIVCPECGSWDIDNLGDGVVALCNGMKNEWGSRCGHEWESKWP